MTDPTQLASEEINRIEVPTCRIRWWRHPATGERSLQQCWQVSRLKTGGVVSTYDDWRDVPEESFYGY